MPFSALIIFVLGKTLRRVGRKGQEQMGDLYSIIQENIQAAPVVKAYGAEKNESERFQTSNQRYLHLGRRFAQADTVSSPLMEVGGRPHSLSPPLERGSRRDSWRVDGRIFSGLYYLRRHDLPALEELCRVERSIPVGVGLVRTNF